MSQAKTKRKALPMPRGWETALAALARPLIQALVEDLTRELEQRIVVLERAYMKAPPRSEPAPAVSEPQATTGEVNEPD